MRLTHVMTVIRPTPICSERQRQPLLQDFRPGDGFHRNHQHPEIPIQPADDEARAVAQACAGELGERAHLGQRGGHFAQHAHDQQDQQPA